MKDYIIHGDKVSKVYINGDITTRAVDEIDFNIAKSELVIILGQSGAGKSTLLNLLGGMDTPTSGDLFIEGQNVSKFTRKDLINFRRNKIGFIFQFYNLMPNLTARENVELAAELKNDALSPVEVLSSVGLENKINNFPAQLSGGEQQRVSIARAVAKNCDIILCDEPTGALDYETGKEILSILSKEARENNKTVIIVTHNSALADMGDHIYRMKNGKFIKDEYNKHPMKIEDIEW